MYIHSLSSSGRDGGLYHSAQGAFGNGRTVLVITMTEESFWHSVDGVQNGKCPKIHSTALHKQWLSCPECLWCPYWKILGLIVWFFLWYAIYWKCCVTGGMGCNRKSLRAWRPVSEFKSCYLTSSFVSPSSVSAVFSVSVFDRENGDDNPTWKGLH